MKKNNDMVERIIRLKAVGNHDGVRHLVTFAAESVVPRGNAADRRRARRRVAQIVRQLASEAA